MLAPSVLQPRKSEVKHGVRHREQPRKQEARGNTQTATPPQAQARPRQSPGNAEPPTRARAPACARARQRAPGPQRMPGPQHARARQRMPEPPTHARAPARAGTKTWWVRCRPCSGEPSPQRTPGRKPGSGALIEPTIGLRDANRATRRVPRALAGPSSEFPLRRIVIFVQPWSILTILRSLKAKMHDYLRYRETHARTIDKNVRSPLPRPRKTVCFDRQRPKQTVFRIAHPQGEGAAPSSKGLCKRHGTKHGFLYMLEPLTVRKRLRAPAASRYSVRKRKRPHKTERAKERAWRRLG